MFVLSITPRRLLPNVAAKALLNEAEHRCKAIATVFETILDYCQGPRTF